MIPGARLQATIGLLDAAAASQGPADRLLARWGRHNRYAGGGDRRAVFGRFWAVQRRRAQLDWWLGRAGVAVPDGRTRTLASLTLTDGLDGAAVAALFNGAGYAPAPLEPVEAEMLAALAGEGLEAPDQPPAVRANLPEWLLPEFQRAFGDDLKAEMAALNREAPTDLRVNTLKGDRAAARAALAAGGLEATETPYSPVGLRLAGRTALPATAAWREGLVEVQDEASQLVARLVDARPGAAVCDFCAGAGGKTLALAATMENQGRILAADIAAVRLSDLPARLDRAGIGIVDLQVLSPDRTPPQDLAGGFDRVLVDAPCSGTGIWRRAPDMRWRLRPDELARRRRTQASVIDHAATLVVPGGRLVWATCSVLPAENDDIVAAFLDRTSGFRALAMTDVWAETVGGAYPGGEGPYLRLTPARHGTDGFFVAVFERAA